MSISFLESFNLQLDTELTDDVALEKTIQSVGCLSSMAQDCANVNALLSDGTFPNDLMIRNLSYASAVLSSLVNEMSGELELLQRRLSK